MEVQKIKADLHTHGFCGWSTGKGQGIMRLFGDNPERSLGAVAHRGVEEKTNTLIGFVNFNDTRYEGLVNTRGRFPGVYDIYDDYKKTFVGVYNKLRELWCFILRGQEIPTEIGHVLVIGGEKNIEQRKFEEVVKAAKDMDVILIADHPLAELGLMGKVYGFITGSCKRRISLGRYNLENYVHYFDAIEAGNSNFPELVAETEKLAQELDLAKVYTSDSHTLPCMFSSYMAFRNLDFSTPEKLRADLRRKTETRDYSFHSGRNRRLETLFHGMAVAYNIARQKAGLVKEEKVEIK